MVWEETVMSREQMLTYYPDFTKLIADQAELSFKAGQQAGRKEVAKYVEDSIFSILDSRDINSRDEELWQEFLKSKGVEL